MLQYIFTATEKKYACFEVGHPVVTKIHKCRKNNRKEEYIFTLTVSSRRVFSVICQLSSHHEYKHFKTDKYFKWQLVFSNILPTDGSVHWPKHVALSDQYTKGGVIDGSFPTCQKSVY